MSSRLARSVDAPRPIAHTPPVPLPRPSTLRALALACTGAALAWLPACPLSAVCPSPTPWRTTAIATMASNDLHALTPLSDYDAESGTSWDYLLVGGTGTLVVLGTSFDESSASSLVETKQFGAVALHAALELDGQWWIVGDQGLAAYTIDRAATWTNNVLGTSASLYDLALFPSPAGEELVIVGDEVVFVRQQNGVWVELPAPAGEPSWGQLRSVYAFEGRLYLAGLSGALWSSELATSGWVRETPPSPADLFALGEAAGALQVVGAGGAMLERDPSGEWLELATGTSLDLIDYAGGVALTREGGLLVPVDAQGEQFEAVPALAGARALSYAGELMIVGEAGAAQRSEFFACAL